MAAIQAIPQVISDKLPLIVSSTIVFLAVCVFKYLVTPDPLATIPVIRQELDSDDKRREEYRFKAKEIYADGYSKVHDGLISSCKDRVLTILVETSSGMASESFHSAVRHLLPDSHFKSSNLHRLPVC